MNAIATHSDGTGWTAAPWLTHPVEPIGGCIKRVPADFQVEEVPAHEPAGEGEHLWLVVEKENMSTGEMLRVLERHFGVHRRALGYAGMKDKRAVTRQVVSVHTPGAGPDAFPMLQHERVRILASTAHTKKLRRGLLAGNRFNIRIRDVDVKRVADAHRMLRFLAARGFANLYGPQRFGFRRNNHVIGRLYLLRDFRGVLDALLGPPAEGERADGNDAARAAYAAGDYARALDLFPMGLRHERQALSGLAKGLAPADAVMRVDELQRRFWVTAWQSAVFNRICVERMQTGTLDTLVEGDIAVVNGERDRDAFVRVDRAMLDDPVVAERVKRVELSPTGPMPGGRMQHASDAPGLAEERELSREGVPIEALERAGKELGEAVRGTRRPMRAPIRDGQVDAGADEHGPFIRLSFELDAGCYATSVLREIMKVDPQECAEQQRERDTDGAQNEGDAGDDES